MRHPLLYFLFSTAVYVPLSLMSALDVNKWHNDAIKPFYLTLIEADFVPAADGMNV